MAINQEKFVKLKRFSDNFTFDDTADQVVPKDASDTVKGVIRIATAAEITAGTETEAAITPAQFADALKDAFE